MLQWLIGIILGEIICKSSNWQHIQRLTITILSANWQLFRLERIAKCSYFTWSTQNIKFYWFVMKIKKFLLPIWWYNRGVFPLGNKYFGVFVLNGLRCFFEGNSHGCDTTSNGSDPPPPPPPLPSFFCLLVYVCSLHDLTSPTHLRSQRLAWPCYWLPPIAHALRN